MRESANRHRGSTGPGKLPLTLVIAALALAGCGGGKEVEPLLSVADKARDAQALSSVQQALVTAAVVRADSGGAYGSGTDDLVRQMQERDPSRRYTTAPPTGPEVVQVLGGGSGPVMLVARSAAPAFLAVWDDGGSATLFYRGADPPQYVTERPTTAGWSDQRPL